ncbi:MAG TPA: RidA family protein [Desulforhopalus sp.]|nr:RidA family protein [Desulforhopalus sp.]
MPEISRIETSQRMSRIVIHAGTIYLCGQVADGGLSGITAQTENMLAKVDTLLQQAGSDRSRMLAATIYLRDMVDFPGMNEVWDNWIPKDCAPARACVESRLARPDLLVEITVIAAAG